MVHEGFHHNIHATSFGTAAASHTAEIIERIFTQKQHRGAYREVRGQEHGKPEEVRKERGREEGKWATSRESERACRSRPAEGGFLPRTSYTKSWLPCKIPSPMKTKAFRGCNRPTTAITGAMVASTCGRIDPTVQKMTEVTQ